MTHLLLNRASHLLVYCEFLAEQGVAVQKYLSAARLPGDIWQSDYIASVPARRFLVEAASREGIRDLGFQASQKIGLQHFSETFREGFDECPTLFSGLVRFGDLASRESTGLRAWISRHEGHFRVHCSRDLASGLTRCEFDQWICIMLMISIVREFAAPDWQPATIAFQSGYSPGQAARDRFRNTRFLSGEKTTWIDIPARLLVDDPGVAAPGARRAPGRAQGPAFEPDFLEALKLVLRPYIRDEYPSIELAADVTGRSVRTLQRRVAQWGLSYSDLIKTLRYEIAKDMLRDDRNSITDIAYAVGYSDHSHFTRAFRQSAGMTPREFREKGARHQEMAAV